MKSKQYAGYKIVELDRDTIVINCKDLRKEGKLVRSNCLRGVRGKSETTKKRSKVLLRQVSLRELAKESSKSNSKQRGGRGIKKPQVTKQEEMKRSYTIMFQDILLDILKGK